ncbi:RHS repeat-associated core domain-containing protein [Pseudomonas vlassakiae]|uniref:RHS repeat-associated core domain-containing protein n=1 Tax=Pseudomonas vlassakiae TaxID=485888 RepID=A0A923GGK4_9PSED|nr:RHS repeat-associated core domain-containing protein [Pseudomonas vlassakiae]MBV4540687.1 RHS repeat-associated core domain-containing protein [Pseudomonas vlassakiae]
MRSPPPEKLLACSSAHSTHFRFDAKLRAFRSHCPYGHLPTVENSATLLGFHGEFFLLGNACIYLLGNGYRAYSPSLKRFLGSDSCSPFGRGGLNSYTAFSGNPVNFKDPDGHGPITLKQTKSLLDPKALSLAPLQQEFASRKQLVNHRVLQTQLAERPGRDLATLLSKADVGQANFNIVGSANDLQHVGKRPHKFIFTNQAELIIGEASREVDFSHPHLTYFARGEKQVISAGMITRQENGYVLSDYTGHYHRSAEGVDTLAAPLAFLHDIGVEAIRHT